MKNITCRHLLLLFGMLLALLPWAEAEAQQGKMAIASFNRMETDITARVTAPRRDQNGEICALIRIVTNVKDLYFEPDALGIVARENKPGEIWIYVPRGARRISIMHETLGIIRNYFYPELVEKGVTYEMVLNSGERTDKPVVEDNMQLLVMRPEPTSANVYIDDELMPLENGFFSATMKKGEHTYRVEAPMYQPEAGVVTLGDEQKIMNVALKPKFGYMELFSLPVQGAKVTIDSVEVGVTPFRSDRMAIKSYNVRIEKEQYFPIDTVISVKAGETESVTFQMVSTIKPRVPWDVLITAQANYHPSTFSYGGMIGFMKKWGFYARFVSDFGSAPTELECNDEGMLVDGSGQPYFSGKTAKARMSVTAGALWHVAKPLYLYLGGGYGNVVSAWETVDGKWAKNIDHSATGAAAELGGILRFGKFAFSVGFHTVGFKHHEVTAGIGVIF